MSFCHECGETLVEGWSFCQWCGSAVGRSQPQRELITVGGPPRRARQLVAAPDSPGSIEAPAVMAGPPAPDRRVAMSDQPTAAITTIEEMLGSEWTSELTSVIPPADVPPTPAKPGRSPRLAIVALAAFAAFAVLSITASHIVGTHDRLNRTRDVLASTETDLKDTTTELNETRDDLSASQADLKERTSQRDAAQNKLSDTQAELDSTVASLDDARGKVDLQASVIEDLRTCLDGVASAAIYMADGYYMSALDELNRVEPACDRANSAVV
jgi:hypothetical protein